MENIIYYLQNHNQVLVSIDKAMELLKVRKSVLLNLGKIQQDDFLLFLGQQVGNILKKDYNLETTTTLFKEYISLKVNNKEE